jgi:hypothetical protein
VNGERWRSSTSAISGLGDAALDRALAEQSWLQDMVERTRVDGPLRATEWAKAALARADLELRWTITSDRSSAVIAERRLIAEAEHRLWNRRL